MPWDEKKTVTDTQRLISSTIHEWYDAKHPEPSADEIKLINSRKVIKCPYCGSQFIVKDGHYKDGIQAYKCHSCNRKSSPLSNTIFADRKIPISEWIEYLIYLFEFHSIRTAARDNRNANTTGKYWLIKVFEVLKGIQDNVVLDGDVYIDEMYFPVIKSKVILKDGKKLRGISKNKIGVAAGYDLHGHILLINEKTSKPSFTSTWRCYGNHIKEGSHLIHDAERSHSILVDRLNLTSTVYPSDKTRGLTDEENPLDKINNIHSLAKRYMKAHGGYNRDNLQDWMNLIWFILIDPENRYEKIEKFINLAMDSPKRVKYRDAMSK